MYSKKSGAKLSNVKKTIIFIVIFAAAVVCIIIATGILKHAQERNAQETDELSSESEAPDAESQEDSSGETNDSNTNDSQDGSGGLSDEVFDIVKGHYRDYDGDTVDIISSKLMKRYILGGKQDHIYDEEICGYAYDAQGDQYIIYVLWDGDKYAYFYTEENGDPTLYVDFDDGWNPSRSNCLQDGQVYVKVPVDER